MSLEYAESRIKEALKAASGNKIKARQQVIAWTYEDAKLLHALTKAHLSGIVAYNIERVASGRADLARAKKAAPINRPDAPKKSSQPTAKKGEKEESFGLQILKAAGASSTTFGFEDAGGPQKRGASQSHINAIRAIAESQKKKS